MRQARETEINVKSKLLPKEDEEVKESIYEGREIYENVPIEDLMNYENCIIIYGGVEKIKTEWTVDGKTQEGEQECSKTNLNKELDRIIEHWNYIPTGIKNQQFRTTRIKFNKTNKNVYLELDPKDQKTITWKEVRNLCEKVGVPFRNQSFASLVKELRERFEKAKSTRHEFTKEERTQIYSECKGKCNN